MQRILEPGQIETLAQRSIPRTRLPDRARVFSSRAGRLRELSEDLRREQEIARTLLDHVPAMIVLTDEHGRPDYLNRECERLLGWSSHDTRQRDLMQEAYPDPEYRHNVALRVREAAAEFFDVSMRTKDGREIDVAWVSVPLSDGRRVGFGIDISARKAAEDARRETEERTRELNEELAEANQRKDEFLAVLAHELCSFSPAWV